MVMASFGGGAIIVIGLSKWLGGLWAGRILQDEQSKLDEKLEDFRHELAITKSSYEHHLDLILDYYSVYYEHYRRCQRAAYIDAYRELPDGEMKNTNEEFIDWLALFLPEWAKIEAKARLLLPSSLLELHDESVLKFNQFKKAVHEFSPAERQPRKKELVFREIEETKVKMEEGLREFLRTESLLK